MGAPSSELPFSSDAVERFWSRIASGPYEAANARFARSHRQRFDLALPRLALAPGARLLNVWSRQGEAIPLLRGRYPDLDLVNAEISRTMIEQTRARFPGESVHATDLQSLPFPDEDFDAVLSLETLEHSPSPARFCRELHRVLRPGGRLVLTCPPAVAELHLWLADRFLGNHGEGPHRFPSSRQARAYLEQAGFDGIEHRASLFLPLEAGALARGLNALCERLFQWYPASELGLRQLFVAQRPAARPPSDRPETAP